MNDMEPQTSLASRAGLILADDLMFASQVQGLARSAGIDLQWVRDTEKALAAAKAARLACVIVDVNLLGAGIGVLVTAIKALGKPGPAIIGYGSHVDATSLQQARDAGCGLVVSRSKLVQEVAGKLLLWIESA